ncbi:M28 family metallopeptidase [Portibacter marinus]|uniref:M28 family metallopeptidase n=1 Tax=Portibacter marinus TaxID=2898660 RepID=UPI001F34AB16|nr:M28 family metallopeptidase [Portibacter marinus]
MRIQTKSGELNLQPRKDFVVHTERGAGQYSLNNSDLVFCGFGIVSEKDNWNDYAGMDMEGKTAVVLVNDPGFGGEDSTFFKGNTMTFGGRWDNKYDFIDELGADGLLIIHQTSMAGYPWFVIQSSWTGPKQGLADMNRENDTAIKGWITIDAAQELFKMSGQDFTAMINAARTPGFKPIPLEAKVSVQIEAESNICESQNVIGILPGQQNPEEYLLYTAHWDHIGVGEPIDGDSIYNGALDNASGTSTVLAIAEMFATAEQKPDRSVAFLLVTAEEQGLLGSEYYAEKPTIPNDQIVANLNMDGVNPAGEMKDLSITGMGYSTMDDIAAEEAKKQGRYTIPEQEPEKGYFYRSDQFNFAKKGIPVLYAGGTYDHKEKGKAYAKEFTDTYIAKRYHAPADNFDPEDWNFGGMLQDGQLYFNVGWHLANSDVWPEWKPDSEFGRPVLKK